MKTQNIDLLYEDNDIIVCKKPSGVPTQSSRIGVPDMVSILKNHLSQSAARSGDPYLAVIHRLDQPVSGILVFAKTPAAARALNAQLTSRGFGKHYRALVAGVPEKGEADLENYLVKDARTNTSRICSKDTPGARFARLHYRTVKPEDQLFRSHGSTENPDSIGSHGSTDTPGSTAIPDPAAGTVELDILLDTGRHHQIRVQLAGIGCPIIGDTKYGPAAHPRDTQKSIRRDNRQNNRDNRQNNRDNQHNICLCAYRLEFTHPATRKPMTFELTAPN